MESYNKNRLEEALGYSLNFVQDNESRSSYGVIRGLHFQKEPFAQAKLVRVIEGSVLDVAVDLRIDSETFGRYFTLEISGVNKKQLLVPKGFAHGYSVLSKTALFAYKCDGKYDKESESGITYDDAQLDIDWRIPVKDRVISAKDQEQQSFTAFVKSTKN